MYSVAQFAKQVGVSVKTLQRWDREGSLKAKRTLSGRRYYDEDRSGYGAEPSSAASHTPNGGLLPGVQPCSKTGFSRTNGPP